MISNLKELLKSEKKEKEEFLNNLKKNDYLRDGVRMLKFVECSEDTFWKNSHYDYKFIRNDGKVVILRFHHHTQKGVIDVKIYTKNN